MTILLKKALELYPNSKIIVTGYYKIVSKESNPTNLLILARLWRANARVSYLSENSAFFHEQSDIQLRKAVKEVNETDNRVFLALPTFEDDNAIFAKKSYLWGLGWGPIKGKKKSYWCIPADIRKKGGNATEREKPCEDFGYTGLKLAICRCSSVGHPNVKGALAYVEAIKQFLPGIIDAYLNPQDARSVRAEPAGA